MICVSFILKGEDMARLQKKTVKPKPCESVVQKRYDATLQILNSIIPRWIAEYRFHPPRRWRFDYCHIEMKVAVEIEGGAFSMGRHTRGKGFIGDMEKYNTAQLDGWKVLRYTPQQMVEMMRDVEILRRTK